jgi:hydrogenase expression/formation protein HypE
MGDEGKRIVLGHGSGGRLTHELVLGLFARRFSNPALDRMDDSAVLEVPAGRLAFTTDSFVVDPLEFPGGDIGRIAVCGTVNDLSMQGARPAALSAACILEEGLELDVLGRIADSMAAAAREAGVPIVCGDTKVVEKGKADKVFITTAGVGVIAEGVSLAASNVRPGDEILVSGPIAEHGVAVMNARHRLGLEGGPRSDAAPLNSLVSAMLACGGRIRALRDLTRGGLATAAHEVAAASGVTVELSEPEVPVGRAAAAACELLGLDPLYVANEGRLMAFVAGEDAPRVLSAMRGHPLGREARRAGRAVEGPGRALLRTWVGGVRPLMMLDGEQLPRIC